MWEVRLRQNNSVCFSAPSQAECTLWLSDRGLITPAPSQNKSRYKVKRWHNQVHRDYVMVDTRLEESTSPAYRTSIETEE